MTKQWGFPEEMALVDMEEAEWIVEVRNYPCSWRALAQAWVDERHPELHEFSGNQILGMELCQRAIDVLGWDAQDDDLPIVDKKES